MDWTTMSDPANSLPQVATMPAANILLVDDTPANLVSLAAILGAGGYGLVSAGSGEEALRILNRNNDFAAIVLDVMMPGMDGFETARLIQQRESVKRIPIIFLTAAAPTDWNSFEAYATGAVDFLTKPISPMILRSKIEVFAELYRKNRELQAWSEILEQRVAERTTALRAAEANYRLIAENAGDLIAMLDREGRRLYASPSFNVHFSDDQVAEHSDSFAIVHPEDRSRIQQTFVETVESGQGRRAEFRCIAKDGTVRHFESVGDPVLDENGTVSHVVVVSRDITERRAAEDRIRYLALHDALTGLANRALFSERIGQTLAHARRRGSRVAVMFVDLDRFKVFNDSLGHDVGDHLLAAVAERLRACLRQEDTVARLGGDEFAVLVDGVEGESAFASIAQKIIDAVRIPVEVDGHELNVGASIGISVFPDDGDSPETLLKHADLAMYQVKASGRNHFRFYRPELNQRADRRMTIENGLRRALDRGELVVHYQPELDLASGGIVAMEALLRWQHPELGLLFPESFLDVAEDTGLVVPIGEWVLMEACRQQRAWQEAQVAAPAVVVSVNLSALQFQQRDLVATVRQCLSQTGLPPNALELEITETALMNDAGTSVTMLRTLNDLGVGTAVDDFGTGYSSLAYLKRFPVRKLKIDRSFVREVDSNLEDAAIVRAIVSLARSLQLSIVAEGIETEAQAAFLHITGCQAGQGHYFAAPFSAAEATQWLSRPQKNG